MPNSQYAPDKVKPERPTQKADDLNCAVHHPIDLGHVRPLHREILSVEKSQRMAEFF
ncbi:hypothetical protein K9N68_29140 [Kovacikia minuta CCNUW1]|uniref:hypothetical protein n=1 Tax=Kovacikia minuta TaxID=2931930 RepID=UPI001CCD9138|nr:hypothetical protein [Kovacikia minuta]UBF25593.1 hypothetical protein K9N68_29140 [Kovacikia minuta CCNUW1]